MTRNQPFLSLWRVEVCGGIASGKTTLARLFKRHVYTTELEQFKENPLWRLFYQDPSEYAFATEVTFFLQHYAQIKKSYIDSELLICDFSLLQDRAYADVNLTGGQLKAFNAVYRQATSELAPPSLIVRLECGAQEELNRIQRRARAEESRIQIGYLNALNRAIKQRVAGLSGRARVLIIDSETNDFAHDKRTQRRIIKEVLSALKT